MNLDSGWLASVLLAASLDQVVELRPSLRLAEVLASLACVVLSRVVAQLRYIRQETAAAHIS